MNSIELLTINDPPFPPFDVLDALDALDEVVAIGTESETTNEAIDELALIPSIAVTNHS